MVWIRVLGPMHAEVDGAAADLGGPRQRGVLALLLASRGDVVSVDRMISDLWRGEPPPRAIASLQAYVSNLRRILEPDRPPRTAARILVSAAPGYTVRLDDTAVDAWTFERLLARARQTTDPAEALGLLDEALRLWRGPSYAEFAGEEWAMAESARLDGLQVAARELHTALTLRTGSAATAVPAAELITRQHPLREEGWRLLGLALWGSGRPADALAALRRARGLFADELGLDPGPALLELEQAILTQRAEVLHAAIAPPALPPPPAPPVPAGPPMPLMPPMPLTPPMPPGPLLPVSRAAVPARPVPALFVGRTAETGALREAAAAARAGAGGVALVSGEAGSGKSSLLLRVQRELEDDGWLVLGGRCPEDAGAPPAWAWTEALRTLAERVPPGPHAPAVGALLSDEATATGTADTADAAAGRFRLHRAVCAWLRDAAGAQPTAVFLDDLHAADTETLTLLGTAAAELAGAPVLLAAAYRPAESGPAPATGAATTTTTTTMTMTETMAGLARRSPARIQLTGLGRAEVTALVADVCGSDVDPELVTALADRTGGNPFYVKESARLLASEGALVATSEVPEGVRDVLRRRFARLPAPAVSVLRLAAVVGRESDVDVLVGAADVDEAGVLDALDAGLISGLLTEPAPGRVRFVHALVRDTLYTDLSGLRRGRWHARVADELRRLHPADLAGLAHHYTHAAGPDTAELAVGYSVRAAEAAERRYAHDASVTLLSQAIAAHARLTGDAGSAPADPDRPARDWPDRDWPDRDSADRDSADRDSAGTGWADRDWADKGDADKGWADERVALLGRLLRAQIRAGGVAAARSTRDQAVAIAETAGRPDLLLAAFTAWTEPTPWQIHPYGTIDERAVGHLTALLGRTDLAPAVRCQLIAALCAELEGEGDPRMIGLADQAAALAAELDDPWLTGLALTARTKDPAAALDPAVWASLADDFVALGDRHDLVVYRWFGEYLRAKVAAANNDPAGYEAQLERADEVAATYRMAEPWTVTSCGSAMLAHVRGDFAGAERGYRETTDAMLRHGSLHAVAFRQLALLTVGIDDPTRMRRYEADARAMYERFGPLAADAVAVIAALNGDVAEARRLHALAVPPKHDFFWVLFATVRAIVVVTVGAADQAAELIDELTPYADQLAGVGSVSLVLRPVAHTLGELELLLGRTDSAERHFEQALRVAQRWGSPHWTAAARERLAGLQVDRR